MYLGMFLRVYLPTTINTHTVTPLRFYYCYLNTSYKGIFSVWVSEYFVARQYRKKCTNEYFIYFYYCNSNLEKV